jgi:O-antigen/teichoic acid export membrane protein
MSISSFVKSNGVVGGASILMMGTFFSQLIIILVSPILTRIYSPEDFGIFSVYIAIVAFFATISNLRYELAIPISKSLANTLGSAKLSLLLVMFTSITLWVILYISGEYILGAMNAINLYNVFWLIPLGVFIGGTYNLFTFWSLKKRDFIHLSIGRMLQGAILALLQVILGIFKLNFVGLILGHVTGFFITVLYLLRKSIHVHIFAIKRINFKTLKKIAIRYKKFPKFSTFSDAMNVIGVQSPAILFASLFSISAAGYYMLASRVMSAPIVLIAESIGKAFLIESTSNDKQKLKTLTMNIYVMLLKLSIGPLFVFGVIAPDVFTIVFGNQWTESGLYAQAMIPWIFSVFVFVPMMQLYVTFERQDIEIRFQTFILVSRVTGIIIGAIIGDVVVAIVLYSIFAFISYTACGIWIMSNAGLTISKLVIRLIKEMIMAAAFVLPLFIIKNTHFFDDELFVFLISIILIGFFIYRSRGIVFKVKNAR